MREWYHSWYQTVNGIVGWPLVAPWLPGEVVDRHGLHWLIGYEAD